MNNVTALFNDIYSPQKALVVYISQNGNQEVYVEAYDMDRQGRPVNAHPLSAKESAELASSLDNSPELKRQYLKSKGLMPENILYIDPQANGFAMWYTPAREINLFFKPELGIASGKAKVPPLLWQAYKDTLYIYALKGSKRPGEKTFLFHAPFFNVYEEGNVCMGTVDIDINSKCPLEDFMAQWEHYFWNSYFSHLVGDFCPVDVNIVQLWKQQVAGKQAFPLDVLKKTGKTIGDIIR
jgi:PRTRC genetic system protein B